MAIATEEEIELGRSLKEGSPIKISRTVPSLISTVVAESEVVIGTPSRAVKGRVRT